MVDIIAAVAFLALFSVWKRDDLLNTVIKIVMLLLGLALAFQALQQFGFVVHT